MKILMATMGMNIGGAETHILELSKELKHQGHDVIIVSNGGVYVPEIEAAGIRHYQAPMHRRAFGRCAVPGPFSVTSLAGRGQTWSMPMPGSRRSCAAACKNGWGSPL